MQCDSPISAKAADRQPCSFKSTTKKQSSSPISSFASFPWLKPWAEMERFVSRTSDLSFIVAFVFAEEFSFMIGIEESLSVDLSTIDTH